MKYEYTQRFYISHALKTAIWHHELPAYKIAQACDAAPNWIYKIMAGIMKVKLDDPRLINLLQYFGMGPEQGLYGLKESRDFEAAKAPKVTHPVGQFYVPFTDEEEGKII